MNKEEKMLLLKTRKHIKELIIQFYKVIGSYTMIYIANQTNEQLHNEINKEQTKIKGHIKRLEQHLLKVDNAIKENNITINNINDLVEYGIL